MAQASPKIVLSASRDIPFNKLVLSQANVRRIKSGMSIEELAEDIARRSLLQSLSVRPVINADGAETGMFEVPAGGRRYRALELLVKQKRLAKTAPVPCIVRSPASEASAEEDSLAENTQREALHPLDQFRAFKAMIDKGMSEEDIAARFFVTPAIVRQRLRLVSASEKLLALYEAGEMSLEQLMAFTVTSDHKRQEDVWKALAKSYTKEPYYIRRLLTESGVRVSDRRAQFVGVEAYEAAGGAVMRDLFTEDNGGWLQDPALVERLAKAKLQVIGDEIAAEGWKWVAVAIDFSYGHTAHMRRLRGEPIDLTDDEIASRDALQAEFDALNERYDSAEDLPEEVDARFGELETALEAFEQRPLRFDSAEIAIAGAFVSLDGEGCVLVERGFVRREDEPAASPDATESRDDDASAAPSEIPTRNKSGVVGVVDGSPATVETEAEEDGPRPLPDRLVEELTAHRTLALRDALAGDVDAASLAALHCLALQVFYSGGGRDSCLELRMRSVGFSAQATGLKDAASARAISERETSWAKFLPEGPEDLWSALGQLDADARKRLFAHCVAQTLNAVQETVRGYSGQITADGVARRVRSADAIAAMVGLDMAAAGWAPTQDNYLGRVTKTRILEAVREARGEAAAQLIDHLKKADMAREAERLLEGSGWLPEPLRLADDAGQSAPTEDDASVADDADEALPAFLTGDLDPAPDHAVAAE